MASGRISKYVNSNITLHMDWESTYYESSNSSDLYVEVILEAEDHLELSARYNNTLTIDGTSYDFTSPKINTSSGGKFTLTSKTTYNISHNADNTKSVALSCRFRLNATLSGTEYGAQSWSGTATLDVPKPATLLSAEDFTDEDNPTITYNNPSGGAVGSLQACISLTGGNDDIAYRDISKVLGEGSYTFNLTTAERNVLRNATASAKSRTVVFFIKTVIAGQTTYSKINKTFTVANAAPVINPTITNKTTSTVNLTGSTSKFIRYYSDASVSIGAAAVKGASLNSHITTCGSQYFTSASGTFTGVENSEISFSATDSRGYTTTKTVALDIVPYVKLTCNLSNNRPDTSGNMVVACSGNYWEGNFGAVKNTLTVQYRWKVQGGTFSDWINMTVYKSGDTYTAESEQITGLDYQTLYVFECKAADKLLTVDTGEEPIKTLPVFHWGERDVVFEVPVTFNAGVTTPAVMALNDDSNGLWTPTLDSDVISSYDTQQGWYSRVGNNITVGFYIKASCNAGYTTKPIVISGLPFTPTYCGSGGGLCQGQNFQCWVVETDGNIIAYNECCYPDGGDITFSGTINFIVG